MHILLDSKPATMEQVIALATQEHGYMRGHKPPPFNLAVYLLRSSGKHTVHVEAVGD